MNRRYIPRHEIVPVLCWIAIIGATLIAIAAPIILLTHRQEQKDCFAKQRDDTKTISEVKEICKHMAR